MAEAVRPEAGRLLTLMRHGKALDPDAGLDDHARPLAERGRDDIRAVAARTAVRSERPERVLHSDARRTVETAELVRETLGLDADALASDARLYLASAETLLSLIAEQDALGVRHLMIVGHNPGLEELAFRLDGRGARGGLSTAAVCRYARDGERGRLLFEDRP